MYVQVGVRYVRRRRVILWGVYLKPPRGQALSDQQSKRRTLRNVVYLRFCLSNSATALTMSKCALLTTREIPTSWVLVHFSPVHMCAGDAENDVDMLLLAGVGICVGNASPPAKLAAQFIAPTNAEDGAAVAMERLHSSRGASKEP